MPAKGPKSGKKKQHKHKLFGPDFPRTFLTLTPECPGVKKFLPTTGAAGKRTFWCGRPRFSVRTSMTRRVVEKLCTKKDCVDFLAPTKGLSLEPGRVRFRRVRFQTPSSASILTLTVHRVPRRELSEFLFALPKGPCPTKNTTA